MTKAQVTKDVENKTLVIERTFDAPKEKMWQAYADKAMFERWWGPEGWDTTTKEFNFTPGGTIHYCMKCVDEAQGEWFGKESWGLMVISEIDEPNQFSAQDHFSDAEGTKNPDMPTQTFIVEFIEEDGKTRLVNKSILQSEEEMEEVIKMGQIEGFDSQMNKLEKLLAE